MSLPLAPFEEYMLFDDRPTHPMCFFLRLNLSGHCDAPLLDKALRQALLRHPLLSATAQKVGRSSFAWQPLGPSQATVRWQTDSPAKEQVAATYLDLSKRSGLEVIGSRCENETQLLFQFHHSCCDAQGALQLIEDVLIAYANEVSDSPTRPKPDLRYLNSRANFGLSSWELLRIAPKQAVGILGARRFLMRAPAPLSALEPKDLIAPLSQQYPTTVKHEFTFAQTQSILAAAKSFQTTVNNLLASNLFLAIHRFREQLDNTHHRDWIRLSIPISLRRPSAECDSATNIVSMVFLDRRSQSIEDKSALVASIHREMSRIKKNDFGLTFPLLLRLIKPFGIVAGLGGDEQCRCTTVLSNLMFPFAKSCLPRREGKIIAGNLQLDGIDCMPPVRPGTNAVFGVLTYADKLSITQHYDSRVLTENNAQQLLDFYVESVIESAS